MEQEKARRELEKAYERVQETQTEFWEALLRLERLLGIPDIDSSRDFSDVGLDTLIEEAKG